MNGTYYPKYRVEYYNPKTNKMEKFISDNSMADIKSDLNKKGITYISICILKDYEEIKSKFDKFVLKNYKPIMRP